MVEGIYRKVAWRMRKKERVTLWKGQMMRIKVFVWKKETLVWWLWVCVNVSITQWWCAVPGIHLSHYMNATWRVFVQSESFQKGKKNLQQCYLTWKWTTPDRHCKCGKICLVFRWIL